MGEPEFFDFTELVKDNIGKMSRTQLEDFILEDATNLSLGERSNFANKIRRYMQVTKTSINTSKTKKKIDSDLCADAIAYLHKFKTNAVRLSYSVGDNYDWEDIYDIAIIDPGDVRERVQEIVFLADAYLEAEQYLLAEEIFESLYLTEFVIDSEDEGYDSLESSFHELCSVAFFNTEFQEIIQKLLFCTFNSNRVDVRAAALYEKYRQPAFPLVDIMQEFRQEINWLWEEERFSFTDYYLRWRKRFELSQEIYSKLFQFLEQKIHAQCEIILNSQSRRYYPNLARMIACLGEAYEKHDKKWKADSKFKRSKSTIIQGYHEQYKHYTSFRKALREMS